MKILEVYKDVHPLVRGGIERYIHDLSSFLAEKGHEVEVLIAGDNSDGSDIEISGFKVRTTPCIGRVMSNPICPGLIDSLREIPADLVHFHVPLPSAVISWLMTGSKTPYIVTYHSDIVRQAAFLPFYGPFLRKFLNRANAVITTSPVYAETSVFLSRLKNISVIPIGSDLNRFKPSDSMETGDYVLFVGRFRKYKGIHVLLKAWKHFRDRRLIMVGGGPLLPEIHRAVRKDRLNIEIIHDPDDDRLVQLYQGARCLVLPSTLRSEAFGIVQTEAMACGTPVISTSIPTGVPWVNEDGVSGIIVQPDNPDALADAIIRMDDSTLHDRLSRGALERAELLFDSSDLLSKIEILMREVISEINDG
ncbi:MAG: glycosyltransferase [Candidatus Aegiribacteria sp.]|nr:glycosyltransferase [Candidatus Aegiribacteria sp.]